MSPLMLLIILVLVMLAIGVLAWFFMRPGQSNFISRILRKIFGTKKIQPCLLLGDDDVLRKLNFTIPVPGFVTDPDRTGVWHLIPSLAFKLQDYKRRYLLLTERNTVPYNPFVKIMPAKLDKIRNIDDIASESGETAVLDGVKNSRNNLIASAIVIAACAVTLCFLFFIGFALWRNGGISFNFGG